LKYFNVFYVCDNVFGTIVHIDDNGMSRYMKNNDYEGMGLTMFDV